MLQQESELNLNLNLIAAAAGSPSGPGEQLVDIIFVTLPRIVESIRLKTASHIFTTAQPQFCHEVLDGAPLMFILAPIAYGEVICQRNPSNERLDCEVYIYMVCNPRKRQPHRPSSPQEQHRHFDFPLTFLRCLRQKLSKSTGPSLITIKC